jgi:hypothetical protein
MKMNWNLENWEDLKDELRIYLPVEPTHPNKPSVFSRDLRLLIGISAKDLRGRLEAGKFHFGVEGSDWCSTENLLSGIEVIVYPDIPNMRIELFTAGEIAISVNMAKGKIIQSYLEERMCELSRVYEYPDIPDNRELERAMELLDRGKALIEEGTHTLAGYHSRAVQLLD